MIKEEKLDETVSRFADVVQMPHSLFKGLTMVDVDKALADREKDTGYDSVNRFGKLLNIGDATGRDEGIGMAFTTDYKNIVLTEYKSVFFGDKYTMEIGTSEPFIMGVEEAETIFKRGMVLVGEINSGKIKDFKEESTLRIVAKNK